MKSAKLARLIRQRDHFNCEMCGKTRIGKVYEYRSISIVPKYIPHHFKSICGDCTYKEYYGTKIYGKKKKEGTLDK